MMHKQKRKENRTKLYTRTVVAIYRHTCHDNGWHRNKDTKINLELENINCLSTSSAS